MDEKDDFILLMLLLLGGNPNLMDDLKKMSEQEERERQHQQNCPFIEWEQDMGAHIPFCKKDGGFCDLQCIKGRKKDGERCMCTEMGFGLGKKS